LDVAAPQGKAHQNLVQPTIPGVHNFIAQHPA
jgi:hypothetical protein